MKETEIHLRKTKQTKRVFTLDCLLYTSVLTTRPGGNGRNTEENTCLSTTPHHPHLPPHHHIIISNRGAIKKVNQYISLHVHISFADVTEVSFQAEPSATETSEGLTTREYIVIGICSLLLGLIYVASVLLYLHMKKRKRNNGPSSGATNTLDGGASTKNGGAGDGEGNNNAYKNDQVAFGQGFMRSGGGSSLYGSKSRSSLTGRNINGGSMRSMSASTPREEMGIVKSNPLLKHFPIHDSDVELNNGSNNELDEDSSPGAGSAGGDSDRMLRTTDGTDELDTRDGSGNLSGPEEDCLPEENVSIVDEMSSEDKLETMKAIVNGTIRRKLYFNPAYFEPDLLVVSLIN